MTRMWTRALLLGALGLAAGGAVGCAQERAPINQVQADALAKSFFVGAESRRSATTPSSTSRGTVVDVGYGAAQDGLFTSTYAQPRLAHQVGDHRELPQRAPHLRAHRRTPTARAPAPAVDRRRHRRRLPDHSHFDIRRAYNPTTGEELNVVVENTTDRPWYEREYIRVDWSKNLATDSYDFDTLSMLGWIGGISTSRSPTTSSTRTTRTPRTSTRTTGYFDVTNKAFAKPQTHRSARSSAGASTSSRPARSPATSPAAPRPRQLQPGRDHAPLLLPQGRRQGLRAGGLGRLPLPGVRRLHHRAQRLRPRLRHDRRQWYRFADRYNIWERSHYYADPTR